MPRTTSTRKKIFLAAIDCFSQRNYKKCTMQEIADHVDIKAASIYRHFRGKDEILDEIFEYYKINFNKYRSSIDDVLATAATKPMDQVLPMLFYTFGTEEEREIMIKITRIIMDLRFEEDKAQKLFKTTFIDEPTQYLHTAFEALIASGKIKPFDYEAFSFQILAFGHMLHVISLLDGVKLKTVEKMFYTGIEQFARGLTNAELLET